MSVRSMGSCLLCCLMSVAACSAGAGAAGEEEGLLGTKSEAIIRATSNTGRDQVVLFYGVLLNGQVEICTGSYYAPRVVVTAAHCFPSNLAQVFIYYGDNYQHDLAELTPLGGGQFGLKAPAVGMPSHWAQADSWQVNPSYNKTTNASDIATVFLDRKPPFDPLPLYRNRVAANVQLTITGWGSDSAPTPTTGAGSGTERSGRTITLGSPTAADYHADDPNPGVLDPAVQQTWLKTNGAAPWSNGCFGDSGGPLIFNQFGQDYIAGVGNWTGLSCEDYNLFARIDSYLPFLDLSYKRGGQDVLKPTFACVTPNPQGSLTAIFGYENDNGVGLSIPYGTKNASARDTSGLRPTHFDPGVFAFGFGVDFTAGQTASFTLAPDNNPSVTLNATSTSPRCTAAQAVDSGCVLQCRAQLRSGCPRVEESDQCVDYCANTFGHFVADDLPGCNDERVAWQNCESAAAPGGANWSCTPPDDFGIFGNRPGALACADQRTAYENCLVYDIGDN